MEPLTDPLKTFVQLGVPGDPQEALFIRDIDP
jgi:hypothetical protein